MTEERDTSAPPQEKRGVRLSAKQIVGLVLLAVVVVFAVQNTADTEVRFFGADLESPLWAWFLGVLVVGILVGFALPYGRKKD